MSKEKEQVITFPPYDLTGVRGSNSGKRLRSAMLHRMLDAAEHQKAASAAHEQSSSQPS